MENYQQNSIWQKTLARQIEPDDFCKEREFLRVEFENFRNKASILAEEIATILPEFTVHNITHIDALWDMAELIIPADFDINPAEIFVLGGAFLLHDLGMALAAYPMGIDDLKKEQIWLDSYTSLKNKNDVNNTEIERLATEKTIRQLHAKRASELAGVSWKNSSDQQVFLIDNEELRCCYGKVIGLIAHSHCIGVDELEDNLPPTLGALSRFPKEWTIDSVKLACVLRLADAMQIDDRRAPSFLKSIRKLSPLANTHWVFQEKLYQPRIELNRVVYTSKSSFTLNEIDAWWTCFDTLRMIDDEIKQVDALLTRRVKSSLDLHGVFSIDDAKRLSKLITVEGWEPVDVRIKVNDIAKLVSTIGGNQLYGDNPIVPLRELIQNASDAIRARRLLENEIDSYGDVYISMNQDEYGNYLEVEDNGVGMSAKVLTGPFLDFGQSFWGSDLMHEELPGLESNSYKSTGKYGIGFFSVFMWSKRVLVLTNKYNKGREDTLALEFNNGVVSRPIFRKAKPDEYIKNGGTKIRIWLHDEAYKRLSNATFHPFASKLSLSEVVELLCPSIDCNILIKNNGRYQTIVKANDWITMSPDNFIKRLLGKVGYRSLKSSYKSTYEIFINNLTIIKDENGLVVGRIALCKNIFDRYRELDFEGVVTVGGFRTARLYCLIGILIGRTEIASRDMGIPIIRNQDLCLWAESQIKKLEKYEIDDMSQTRLAFVCKVITGQTGSFKVAGNKNGYMNCKEVKEYVNTHEFTKYIIVDESNIIKSNILCYDNVFWASRTIPFIVQGQWRTSGASYWPQNEKTRYYIHEMTIIESIIKSWNCDQKSRNKTKVTKEIVIIGLSNGNEIKAEATIVEKVI